MLSHVTIGTSDFPKAWFFYQSLMSELGWTLRSYEMGHPWAVWAYRDGSRPFVIVMAPADGQPASAGNGSMTAFQVADALAVDRAHALAIELGACDEGAPGPRPAYHAGFYGAYVRDLDGNKLCLCTHSHV